MTLLILGVALWVAAHFWKRIAPAHRASFGDKGKGIVAVATVVSVVLMVIGYRAAEGTVYWGRTGAMTGVNNLLMVVAFYLYAASGKGTKVTRFVRHPQLTGFTIWAGAHLLVNGDTPSFILFGGLGLWAIVEMIVINRAQGPRGAYHAPPLKSEIIAIVATVIVVAVVMAIHYALGVTPWG
jgi:uncharacterized membrane protein